MIINDAEVEVRHEKDAGDLGIQVANCFASKLALSLRHPFAHPFAHAQDGSVMYDLNLKKGVPAERLRKSHVEYTVLASSAAFQP